ncbi:MAG: hypothetical protein BWY79_01386 [Actinobacteria bacterium ADurb.Bin444]|nr:MAG: hypothetical protein BWY79_01386 [Actinobacteria bacterium ADurb.Bin444]
MRRPVLTAATIDEKSSSRTTSEAASRATSVPRCPMATPISAALRAGASLTPSPVMATISPRVLRALISRSFCSGTMRANMEQVAIREPSCSSDISSSCGPVMTSWSGCRPMRRAMACAVLG